MAARLVCPRCDAEHAESERFCLRCGMPLVVPGVAETAVTETQARARKVKRQYLDGELTRVATAHHQAEAELIQNRLLEEGVPSMVRRTGGFDVPDMMFSGPREILVPLSGAELARELLGTTETAWTPPVRTASSRTRWAAALTAFVLFVGGVSPLGFWLYDQLHGF